MRKSSLYTSRFILSKFQRSLQVSGLTGAEPPLWYQAINVILIPVDSRGWQSSSRSCIYYWLVLLVLYRLAVLHEVSMAGNAYLLYGVMRPTECIYSELFLLVSLTRALGSMLFDDIGLVAYRMYVMEWARKCIRGHLQTSRSIPKTRGLFASRSTRAPSILASVRLKGKPG